MATFCRWDVPWKNHWNVSLQTILTELIYSEAQAIKSIHLIGFDRSLGSFSCTNLRSLWGCVFTSTNICFDKTFNLTQFWIDRFSRTPTLFFKFFLVLLLPQWLSLSHLLSLPIFSSSSFTFKGHKGGRNTCWSSTDAKAAAFYLKSSFETRLVQGLDLGPVLQKLIKLTQLFMVRFT